jgi:hypothetical protein
MGTNVSTNYQKNVNDTVTRNTLDLYTQISNSNNSSAVVNQSIEITIGCTPGDTACFEYAKEAPAKLQCGGSFIISQDANISITGLSTISSEQMQDLQQNVLAEYKTAVDQQVEQANKDLSFLQTNISTVVNESYNKSIAESNTAIETTISNTITQNATIYQSIKFSIGLGAVVEVAGDCEFTNSATIEMLAKSVSQSITSVITNQAAFQELDQEITQATKQTNKGLNITTILIIVAVILVLLIVLGVGLKYGLAKMKKDKAKKESAKSGGNETEMTSTTKAK